MHMSLNSRDAWATTYVAGATLVYGLWAAETAFSGWSTRIIAAIVLALGYAACASDRDEMANVYRPRRASRRPTHIYLVIASLLGAMALTFGSVAVIDGDKIALALTFGTIGTLWAMTTVRHAFFKNPGLHATTIDSLTR